MQTSDTLPPCPRCGFQSHNTSLPYPEPLSIQHAINQIDKQIQQLNSYKADLLRQINSFQSSTRNIPPENLSIIFQHLSRDAVNLQSFDAYSRYMNTAGNAFDRNRFVIRLGAVSSLWRQVAWSTPELWTTLIMTVQSHTVHSSGAISQLSLTNAKNLPVTLDLHFPKPALSSSLEQLADTLFTQDNARKIGTLILHNPPIEWISPLSQDFSRLTSLTLKGAIVSSANFLSPRKISLANVPSLRHLTLRGIRESITVIPSAHSLTTLDLFSTAIHICVQLVTQCPNLIECHCRSPLTLGTFTHRDADIPTTASFPHLKVLTWPLCQGRSNTTFLRRIRLPALETLRLQGTTKHGLGQSKELIITHLFAYLHVTLTTLELIHWPHGGWWSRMDLTQLLSCIDTLRSLALYDCFDDFASQVVRVLTPRSVGANDEDDDNDDNDDDGGSSGGGGSDKDDGDDNGGFGTKYLPHLKTLSIRGCSNTSRLLKSLARMVKRRRDGVDSVFRLGVVIRWDEINQGGSGKLSGGVDKLEGAIQLGVAEGRRLELDLQQVEM